MIKVILCITIITFSSIKQSTGGMKSDWHKIWGYSTLLEGVYCELSGFQNVMLPRYRVSPHLPYDFSRFKPQIIKTRDFKINDPISEIPWLGLEMYTEWIDVRLLDVIRDVSREKWYKFRIDIILKMFHCDSEWKTCSLVVFLFLVLL